MNSAHTEAGKFSCAIDSFLKYFHSKKVGFLFL